jgi:methoxymalonate biosynthesis acyl carrier protein
MNDAKERIRQFLTKFLGGHSLKDDNQDVFALGFVNSLFAMQLIAWIEKEFQIQVEDADLDIANFNTVNAIACFAERKQGAAFSLQVGA